jgi:hypothetical protein
MCTSRRWELGKTHEGTVGPEVSLGVWQRTLIVVPKKEAAFSVWPAAKGEVESPSYIKRPLPDFLSSFSSCVSEGVTQNTTKKE